MYKTIYIKQNKYDYWREIALVFIDLHCVFLFQIAGGTSPLKDKISSWLAGFVNPIPALGSMFYFICPL